MESKTSTLKCDRFQGEPYHIYSGDEDNIYETIKKRKLPLPEMYDEVFQAKPPHKEFELQLQVCNANSEEGLTSTYGEFRERKFTNQIRKLNKIIPIWVKIAIPIIVICVIAGYNGMLVTEMNFFEKLNKSTTHNTTSSATTSPTTTTDKSYPSTFAKAATTVLEEVTTAKTSLSYTTNKSWYIPSDSPDTYYCETWQQISTVKFQPLDLQGKTCYTILDCLKFIDLYKFNSKGKANFTFYVDQIGNIYEGRGWSCPYVSGELWIALLTNNFNEFRPTTDIQLRHFYKMVSYKRAFEYFNEDVEEEFIYKCSLVLHTNNYCVYG